MILVPGQVFFFFSFFFLLTADEKAIAVDNKKLLDDLYTPIHDNISHKKSIVLIIPPYVFYIKENDEDEDSFCDNEDEEMYFLH